MTAIKTINDRMKILNKSQSILLPPRTGIEDRSSMNTASPDCVSSQFVPNIFSEDMNDGPLVLIPLTVFNALCSTYDSFTPDQNHYLGVQHGKITKKPIRKHGFYKRKDTSKSIHIDNVAVNKQGPEQNMIVENYQAFPVQKKGIKG